MNWHGDSSNKAVSNEPELTQREPIRDDDDDERPPTQFHAYPDDNDNSESSEVSTQKQKGKSHTENTDLAEQPTLLDNETAEDLFKQLPPIESICIEDDEFINKNYFSKLKGTEGTCLQFPMERGNIKPYNVVIDNQRRPGGQGSELKYKVIRLPRSDTEDNDSNEPDKPREFYIPPTPSTNVNELFAGGITAGINFSKFDSIPIQVSGENVPAPISDFADAGLNECVYNNILKSKYTKPTPIQKTSIPVVSCGRDLIACAQTGSGKTASYLIPIINSLIGVKFNIGKPNVVILTPTRELAIQIYNEALKFAHNCHLEVQILYGGTSTKYQKNLAQRSNILICTVGRLVDFIRQEFLSFECTTTFVLDEADRLLEQGFYDDILFLITHKTIMKPGRTQILMYSATFPIDVQKLAANILRDYVFISVGIVGSACSDIKQTFLHVTKYDKRFELMELLAEMEDVSGIIIFVETKRLADFLATYLCEQNIPSTSIHGDRLQSQREIALRDFKSGRMKILVATNVAARGLDIKNINHVINFDLPFTIEDYVHRIGRTGRLGNKGMATSFFDPKYNTPLVIHLVKILVESGQNVPDFFKDNKMVKFPLSTEQIQSNAQFAAHDIRALKAVENTEAEKDEAWDSSE